MAAWKLSFSRVPLRALACSTSTSCCRRAEHDSNERYLSKTSPIPTYHSSRVFLVCLSQTHNMTITSCSRTLMLSSCGALKRLWSLMFLNASITVFGYLQEVTEKLSWSRQVEFISKTATKAVGVLFRKFYRHALFQNSAKNVSGLKFMASHTHYILTTNHLTKINYGEHD